MLPDALEMHSRCSMGCNRLSAETEPESPVFASMLQNASSNVRFHTGFREKNILKLTNAPPHDAEADTGKPSSATQTTSPPSARLQSNPSISPSFTLGTSFLM